MNFKELVTMKKHVHYALPKYRDHTQLESSYTIDEACNLLGLTKDELRRKCQELGISPIWNENNEFVFTKSSLRILYNGGKFYHKNRIRNLATLKKAGTKTGNECLGDQGVILSKEI